MLLTKEVEIKPTSNTVEYYKSLGYDIPTKRASESNYKRFGKEFVYDFSKTIMVKVSDLLKNSSQKVEVLCDCCKKNICNPMYKDYYKRVEKYGDYVCFECSSIHQKRTCLDKYGVDSVIKLEEVRNQMMKTSLQRYGTINPMQSKEIKKKLSQSVSEKYGVNNISQLQEIKEKKKNTTKTRYGVEYYSQTQEYKEKFRRTCVERYGESFGEQFAKKAFESFYNKTGYNFPSQSPEVKERKIQSFIERYGTQNSLQSPEVREKITKTFYANSSQKASRQQRYINNLYRGILNFPVKHYNVDIYLPDNNLTIEYDGGFHLGNVITGRETQEEFDQKEIIRNNVIKREGYKQMRIISLKDLLPSDQILLQMLSDAKQYFSLYPQHSWIEFNIDTSSLRNAEHKDGFSYDYGELRKIH